MKSFSDMENYHAFLKKSEESPNAAKSCFQQRYYNSCVNRSYFVSGNKRFSHFKGLLNLVQEVRDVADYSDEEISEKRAKRKARAIRIIE